MHTSNIPERSMTSNSERPAAASSAAMSCADVILSRFLRGKGLDTPIYIYIYIYKYIYVYTYMYIHIYYLKYVYIFVENDLTRLCMYVHISAHNVMSKPKGNVYSTPFPGSGEEAADITDLLDLRLTDLIGLPIGESVLLGHGEGSACSKLRGDT